jgi:flagellar assembly factor FliW
MVMDNIKGLIVLVMSVGLMGLLSLIVVDEFMIAAEHNADLDQNIVELLQMSITGIIGLVAGYVGASK